MTDNRTEEKLNKARERFINMDVLRILLAVMVIILHFNNRDMGGALNLMEYGAGHEIFIRFFQSAAICAVNAFLMLSGYFAAVKAEACAGTAGSVMAETLGKTDTAGRTTAMSSGMMIPVRKAVILLLTCSFYRVCGYVCQILFMTPGQFNIRTFIGYMIPNNWFVCLFVTLLLLSPFINRVLGSLTDKETGRLTGLLIVLFGAVPMFVNSMREYNVQGLATVTWQGDGTGFNIGVFAACYVTGYAIRRFKGYWDRFGASFYLLIYILIAALNAAISRFEEAIWFYSSITVIFEAAMLVLAFTRLGKEKDHALSDGSQHGSEDGSRHGAYNGSGNGTDKRSQCGAEGGSGHHTGTGRRFISALAGCTLGIFLWHIMPVMYAGFWVRFDIASAAANGLLPFIGVSAGAVTAMYAVCAVWVLLCRSIVKFISGILKLS